MPDPANVPTRRTHRLPPAIYTKTDYVFFFTVCARQHGSPFLSEPVAQNVIDSLLWTRQRHGWLLFCYCLVPDHLHFVCRLKEDQVKTVNAGARGFQIEGVLDHIARFNSFTTNQAWKHGFSGPLWQRCRYDRVFDLGFAAEEVIEYTLNNPVRKNLVQDWQQWPYAKIVDPWWE